MTLSIGQPAPLSSSRLTLSDDSIATRLLMVALAGAVLFHGGLLPFTHANTYDAFIHMFFADSYHRSWFDLWEPRWYTGFATTSYPPGTHMAIAALMQVMPLRAAFVVVMLTGVLLLTTGVFRFAKLWVGPVPAGYAAILLVIASSISETVHLFGQLPTIFSLGVFLNGLPFAYRWILQGGTAQLAGAVIFASATTACHHVTTIFGGALFVLPLGVRALLDVGVMHPARRPIHRLTRLIRPILRGLLLAVLMLSAIAITVWPYWSWSVSDPITQVPIPHGSRENFLARPNLGFIFFVLPWGLSILFLPYVILRLWGRRMWPLGFSVLLCALLGTGGTTELPRKLLGGAFDILTLDRFTFWASILILPFGGRLVASIMHGRGADALRDAFGRGMHRVIIGGGFAAMVIIAVGAAILPVRQPTQPHFIEPGPIANFMSSDDHDRWRYLTLGFGDQFAYVSAMTTAQSVDGNYHSARRLPDMTRFSVERLENAKYLGVPGLGSLQQFLVNADGYRLKYVFSNDEFYDPLLFFTGWTRLNRLQNGVTVWERADVTALEPVQPRREMSPADTILWGVLPPGALLLAAAIFLGQALRGGFGSAGALPVAPPPDPAGFRRPRLVRWSLRVGAALAVALIITGGAALQRHLRPPDGPEYVITRYFQDLDSRRFEEAWGRLDPETRPSFQAALFGWRWTGGLIASYAKLTDIRLIPGPRSDDIADFEVELHWLSALDTHEQKIAMRAVRRDDGWFLLPLGLRPQQSPERLTRLAEVAWNLTGRRQPRIETDLHRDRLDRPRIVVPSAVLVQHKGRFHLLGRIWNADSEPALTSLFGDMLAGKRVLSHQAAGLAGGQRLMPGQSAGFRIDFEGVPRLDHAGRNYDPAIYVPPVLDRVPERAALQARALTTGQDLYPGIMLSGLRVARGEDGHVLTGLATNTGTQSAALIRITAELSGADGQPVWVEPGFLEENIHPGQSAPFRVILPLRSSIRVIDRLSAPQIVVNGSNQQADLTLAPPPSLPVTVPGYGGLRLHVSTMTHDPVF